MYYKYGPWCYTCLLRSVSVREGFFTFHMKKTGQIYLRLVFKKKTKPHMTVDLYKVKHHPQLPLRRSLPNEQLTSVAADTYLAGADHVTVC